MARAHPGLQTGLEDRQASFFTRAEVRAESVKGCAGYVVAFFFTQSTNDQDFGEHSMFVHDTRQYGWAVTPPP